MQNFTLFRQILSAAIMVIIPFTVSAQETKKEVHVKIVENGVVKKDTVYTYTGEFTEAEHFEQMAEHRARMAEHRSQMAEHRSQMARHQGDSNHRQMMEKNVYVTTDSTGDEFEWVERGDKHMYFMSDSADKDFNWVEGDPQHKEVKVIVHDGRGRGPAHDVEEIWIGEPGSGRPCRTIIIHDGDCPGKNMEKEVTVIVTDENGESDTVVSQGNKKHGKKPAQVNRKVVKSDGGKKVMIIETTIESESEEK